VATIISLWTSAPQTLFFRLPVYGLYPDMGR
jgi:hypothetical protein